MRPIEEGRAAGPTNLLELQGTVRQSLEGSGALDRIRARLRTEIFHAVHPDADANVPLPPRQTIALNSLILEYLRYNHYDNAVSVLEAEMGPSSKTPIDRRVIEEDLGLRDDEHELPLLYGMMATLKDQKQKRQWQAATEAALERRLSQQQQQQGVDTCGEETAFHQNQEGNTSGSAAPLHFAA